MNRKLSYDECISFIEKEFADIELFTYQKEMLKAFCEGGWIRPYRCSGRTLVAKCFGEYVAHVCDRNNDEIEPEFTISWEEVMSAGLITEKHIGNKN